MKLIRRVLIVFLIAPVAVTFAATIGLFFYMMFMEFSWHMVGGFVVVAMLISGLFMLFDGGW